MNDLMSSVSSQIQRDISEAIIEQVLPQIQATLRSGREQVPRKRWNVPADRPEYRPDEAFNRKFRSSSRNEFPRNLLRDEDEEDAHVMVTGDTEFPILVIDFLAGHIPSWTVLKQSNCDHNDFLDVALTAPEQDPPMAAQDPLHSLADVLTSLQNQPSAQQQLTIRPINSNTWIFDGKNDKVMRFEYLFHTMIKMKQEMSKHMNNIHFLLLLRKEAQLTFRDINTSNRQTLEDVLIIFRRKYVKPVSQATAKHKRHRLVVDPNTMKLPDFVTEFNQRERKRLEKPRRIW